MSDDIMLQASAAHQRLDSSDDAEIRLAAHFLLRTIQAQHRAIRRQGLEELLQRRQLEDDLAYERECHRRARRDSLVFLAALLLTWVSIAVIASL